MKRKAFFALLLVLPLSLSTWAQTDTLPAGLSQDIRTPEGLRALVERKDTRFVVVDVRSPEEFAAGHIPTAINIPGGVTADIKDPPAKDKYIVVYCHGGRKSPAAAEKKLADGYQHVFVWGGILSWPYARDTTLKPPLTPSR
jgi:rhodanese-related sulfurtransferase